MGSRSKSIRKQSKASPFSGKTLFQKEMKKQTKKQFLFFFVSILLHLYLFSLCVYVWANACHIAYIDSGFFPSTMWAPVGGNHIEPLNHLAEPEKAFLHGEQAPFWHVYFQSLHILLLYTVFCNLLLSLDSSQ